MADQTSEDCDREARQDAVLAESEKLKLQLLAHTERLETFVAALRERDGETTDGRVD